MRGKLSHLRMNINSEHPLCNKAEETIDYIFINCDLGFNVCYTIDSHCHTPINTNVTIIYWMEYIWIHKY